MFIYLEEALMETVFNILNYGAIGDGVTDCTKAVQNALNDAATCSGKVIVPPGRYKVGHLEMKGQGSFSSWNIGMVL